MKMQNSMAGNRPVHGAFGGAGGNAGTGADAEARRHADLHDPGRRAAQPRRAQARTPSRRCMRRRRSTATLIRVNPDNPSSTTDFVCDLCTEMPKPTDDGKTYTFKIRDGREIPRRHAADRGRRRGELAAHRASAQGRVERARSLHGHGRHGRRARPEDRGVPAEVRHRRLPAGARRSLRLHLQEGHPREGPALVREEHPGLRPVQVRRPTRPASRSRACATRTIITRASPISTASRRSSPPSRRSGSTRSAPTAPRPSSAACRRRRATSWSRSWATRSRCRPATGTAATCSRRTTRRSRSTTCGCAARWPWRSIRGRARRRCRKIADRAHRRRHRLPRLAAGGDQGGAAEDRRLLARHREVARRGAAAPEGGRRRRAELRAAEPQRRPALQISSPPGLIDEWSKIGLKVTQRVLPTGPFYEALRGGTFEVAVEVNCQDMVNPLLDVAQGPAALGLSRELRRLRGPEADRALQHDAARDRSGQAARADARVREATCSTPRSTRIMIAVVEPHRRRTAPT